MPRFIKFRSGADPSCQRNEDLYGTLSDPETLQNCALSDTGKTWPISIKLCGLGT